eukprot:12918332-Prorocentrum_lima.AAC.1
MEENYERGHNPERQYCPVCQESSGRQDISRPDRCVKFGAMHVDLTGPMQTPGLRRQKYLLVMAHR